MIRLEKLFSPFRIGEMKIKNRLVMPPLNSNFASEEGTTNERILGFYAERAKGGVGLIIVEGTCIDSPAGKAIRKQLYIDDDRFIPDLSRFVEAIKRAGGNDLKVAIQLHHAGRRASKEITGVPPVAPSGIRVFGRDEPRELTTSEIKRLVAAYAQSTRRAKEAGFDGVELQGAHGYLIHQFLSPLTNKRTDQYGGNLEGRARFALEIIKAIKEQAGENYPIIFRLSADEFLEGGLRLKDTIEISQMLEEAGADAIHVSAGTVPSSFDEYISQKNHSIPPMAFPRGCFLNLAEGIKNSIHLPVIAVGRINDPILANEIIAKGKADLVAIGRALIADPEFPKKAAEGRFGEIRKCVACNQGCIDRLMVESMKCAVNPAVGREREFTIRPAPKKKKVLVIGGGPAGMEAARISALRGHDVFLMEKEDRLGGNLIATAAVSFKEEFKRLGEYLSGQMKKLKVKVTLGREVTPEVIDLIRPDAVILAAGSLSPLPSIPGIDKGIVTDAIRVLSGKATVGQKVIVVGGGIAGCEVAAYLAERGKKVTLITRRSSKFGVNEGLAPDMTPYLRKWFLFTLWPKLGIEVISGATFQEVTEDGLYIAYPDSRREFVAGDTIVFALGVEPNDTLHKTFEGKVPELYSVGDCASPRKILEAIHEGAEAAYRL